MLSRRIIKKQRGSFRQRRAVELQSGSPAPGSVLFPRNDTTRTTGRFSRACVGARPFPESPASPNLTLPVRSWPPPSPPVRAGVWWAGSTTSRGYRRPRCTGATGTRNGCHRIVDPGVAGATRNPIRQDRAGSRPMTDEGHVRRREAPSGRPHAGKGVHVISLRWASAERAEANCIGHSRAQARAQILDDTR